LLSLITIEYDIKEDEPEGTEVFYLEVSSPDLIEKLLKRRFPDLSPLDARLIADFSGGNARIAVALAETVGEGETISGLRDEFLFERLFYQRNEPNESLLSAAQALALVYSFEGEDVTCGDRGELFRLGALVDKTPEEMFRCAARLQQRKLVQKRDVWRAVLPQAIANRLAARALQEIPLTLIGTWLCDSAPERMLRSFSRRLGYLSDSAEAQSIVVRWLSPGGMLGDVSSLNDLGEMMFGNVAPVAPRAALVAIERVLVDPKADEPVKCKRYLHLLRSLAHDSALFERCIALISKIALAEGKEKGADEGRKIFASLFPIYLSGTHATSSQRTTVTEGLLLSDDAAKRNLGLVALRGLLEAAHFGPSYNFEFGARSRDYGYWPRTKDDVRRWFEKSLELAESFACSDRPVASEVASVIASQFRGLWTSGGMYDDLERICDAISKKRFWEEGWIGVRETIFHDSKAFTPEVLARLIAIEKLLRPRDLIQKVRSMVLLEGANYVGFESINDGTNDVGKTFLEIHSIALDLGKAIALDRDAFAQLLPELLEGDAQQLASFGEGLAAGSADTRAIWSQVVAQLAVATPKSLRLPWGFLSGLRRKDPELANVLLDDAVEDQTLSQWYPALQTAAGIDGTGVNRLLRSLELGKAWIGTYRSLIGVGATDGISGQDFNRLLSAIAAKPEPSVPTSLRPF
jgi:hypothetical protein